MFKLKKKKTDLDNFKILEDIPSFPVAFFYTNFINFFINKFFINGIKNKLVRFSFIFFYCFYTWMVIICFYVRYSLMEKCQFKFYVRYSLMEKCQFKY